MPNNQDSIPEIELLSSIIDEELKEEDAGLKELIKRKAKNLYPLLSLAMGQNLEDDDLKKKIKLLIEGD